MPFIEVKLLFGLQEVMQVINFNQQEVSGVQGKLRKYVSQDLVIIVYSSCTSSLMELVKITEKSSCLLKKGLVILDMTYYSLQQLI